MYQAKTSKTTLTPLFRRPQTASLKARLQTICATICLGIFALTAPVSAQDAAAETTSEYFIEQPPATVFVIRLDVFESEFQSRIYDPKNVRILASGLPEQRLGALYQLVEQVETARRLRIDITMGRSTAKSKLNMEVIRFTPSGPDQSVLMQAYRLLSTGLQIEPSDNPNAWTQKVVTLIQSASTFDHLGMVEMQNWAKYFAYHLMLIKLDDPITAAEGAREINIAASRSRLSELVLAALQLEASAMAAQVAASIRPTADARFDQAQALFQQAVELAVKLDMQHERARAIYHSGLSFEVVGQTDEAFAKFDEAVAVAKANGDTALANQILQHAAELHESQGSNAEAISLMRQISPESKTPEVSNADAPEEPEAATGNERADREMVAYLFEQGRLLEKTYRHAEAAEVLQEALDLNQKSTSRIVSGPVILLLAKALYGAGRMAEALQHVQMGTKKTPSSGHDEILHDAYGILANIQRANGDFAAMNSARESQGLFITVPQERAAFTFERALDILAQEGPSSPAVFELLRQSESKAKQNGDMIIQNLSVLQRCALGKSLSGTRGNCSPGQTQSALSGIIATGLPTPGQQARFLWSQILRHDGQLSASIAELDRLIEDMRFYQSYLPGVLGAWYSQNHETVFNFFMDLVMEQAGAISGVAGHKPIDINSLAAMDRLTRLASDQGLDALTPLSGTGGTDHKRLRSLIAEREASSSDPEAHRISGEILQIQKQGREQMADPGESGNSLTRQLQQLRDDQALLSYYFAPNTVYAWVGRKDGLTLVSIPWSAGQSAELSREIEGLRLDSAHGNAPGFAEMMDSLGHKLLDPVASLLPKTIYFVPSGRMEGFPLDALRLQGTFLAEQHRVINLLSLDDLGASDTEVGSEATQSFFLAGNRQEQAGDFGVLKPPSAELRVVADFFVGPGLHIVQGAALQWAEFQQERFSQAGIVHLAIPGIMDLQNPQQSRLLLSDNAGDLEHEHLLPEDFKPGTLSADLVMLSACEFMGTNPSSFYRNTRFVAEFLQAGANSVVASLWSVGDLEAARFMQRFYSQLLSNPNVSEALTATKRSYFAANETAQSGAWAAFQLFAR